MSLLQGQIAMSMAMETVSAQAGIFIDVPLGDDPDLRVTTVSGETAAVIPRQCSIRAAGDDIVEHKTAAPCCVMLVQADGMPETSSPFPESYRDHVRLVTHQDAPPFHPPKRPVGDRG